MPEITGKEKADRLPVIISQSNNEQLLGVPNLDAGTGENIAEAVFDLLIEWNIIDKVQAISMDATAKNTGRFNGAAVLLEQKVERNLMYLPCRQHIYELVLRPAFELQFPGTSGPNVAIFKRFHTAWKNKTVYKPGIEDKTIASRLSDVIEDIKEFCKNALKKEFSRHDYKEFLQLAMLFLGVQQKSPIHAPGAVSHARRAMEIYSLKIYIFRDQFHLTVREEKNIWEVCVFLIHFYRKL